MISTCQRLGLATLCFVAAPAYADTVYSDDQWGFEIAQPEGWRSERVESIAPRSVRVNLHGPESSQSGEVCNVSAMDAPATSKLTQAQINQVVTQGVLADSILNEMRSVDATAKRLSKEIVTIDGIAAQETETQAAFGDPGAE